MNSDVRNALLAIGGSVGVGLALYYGYKRSWRCQRQKPYIGGVVAELHVFPVKSLAGFQLNSMEMKKVGPAFDRYVWCPCIIATNAEVHGDHCSLQSPR